MRVGRSLSPGKVFFEWNGVLRKVTTDQMNPKGSLAKSGYRIMGESLIQWGVSDSMSVVDDLLFPLSFPDIPNITTTPSDDSLVEIRNISTRGFQIRTQAEMVHWIAVGRARFG